MKENVRWIFIITGGCELPISDDNKSEILSGIKEVMNHISSEEYSVSQAKLISEKFKIEGLKSID